MRTPPRAKTPEHHVPRLDRDVWAGLIALIVLLMLTAAITIQNTRRVRDQARWVTHTHEVLDLGGRVLLALADAETAQRGFIMTGRGEFLQPYQDATGRLKLLLESLRSRTRDNPIHQARLARLQLMVEVRLARMQEEIAERREGPIDSARLLADNDGSQSDAIRGVIARMQDDERSLLVKRERESGDAYRLSVATTLTTALLGLIAVGALIWLLKRNLEERRLRTEQLQRAEERVRSVIDNVVDGIVTIDDDGVVTSFNPAARRLFQYDPEEVVGRNVRMLMPEPYHGQHDSYLSNYKRTGEARIIGKGREVLGRRKDGTLFPMELAVSEFHIGSERSFIGMIRDVTGRKQMETELRTRAEELADADRKKDEFLAVLAHELRNPLAPILNATAVLRSKGPSDPMLVWARQVIHRQTENMARLLEDLLDVSRIARSNLQIRKERVLLADIIQEAVETSRPMIDAAGLRLVVGVPSTALWLDADPMRLVQAVSNILNNAAKYTDRGGEISLMVAPEGPNALVTIRDTGVGISADYLPHMFDIFSQASPTLERSGGGLGIGLSLVRAIVTMHGGTIEARSDGIGHGSEFTMRLPLAPEPPRQGENPSASDEAPGVPLRIVVADDNKDAREALGTILRIEGHEVHLAEDGGAAITAARTTLPDVVLLDIGMPSVNGYEAARRIRKEPWGRTVVLVALTGWGQSEDRERGAEAGFDYHLVKPVDFAAVRKLLRLVGSATAPRSDSGGAPRE